MKTVVVRLSKLAAFWAVAILFMFGSADAFAQETKPEKRGDTSVRGERPGPEGGRRGRGNPQQQIQHMKEQLGLSEAQVKDIQAVFKKYRPQMEEIRTKYQGTDDRQAARTEMMALQQNIQKEINGLLTADQQQKWQELQQQRRERMRRGPRGERGERGPRPAPPGNADVEGPPPPKVNP